MRSHEGCREYTTYLETPLLAFHLAPTKVIEIRKKVRKLSNECARISKKMKTLICWRYCTALNFSSLLHVLPFHWYISRPRSRIKTSVESRLFLLRKTSFTDTPFCSVHVCMSVCECRIYRYMTSCTVHAASCTHPVTMEV